MTASLCSSLNLAAIKISPIAPKARLFRSSFSQKASFGTHSASISFHSLKNVFFGASEPFFLRHESTEGGRIFKSFFQVSASAKGGDLIELIKKKNEENPVMIYSKSYCPYCSQVKSFFKKLGVSAKVVELNEIADGDDIQDALFDLTKQRTVPNVFIGGKHIGGCDDTLALNARGGLIPLLNEAGIQM